MQLRCLRPLSLPVPLLLLAGCGAGSAGIISATGDDSSSTNSATVLSELQITDTNDAEKRAYRSPAKVSFTLTDQEGDAANVSLAFSTDGGSTFQPATMAGGAQLSNLPPGAYEVEWQYAAPSDLGDESYRSGIIVRAAVSGGNTRQQTIEMGNDPPRLLSVSIDSPTQDAQGVIQAAGIVEADFAVADSSGDLVMLNVEYKLPGEDFRLARSVGVAADEDTVDFPLKNLQTPSGGGALERTYFWESNFDPVENGDDFGQMAGLESLVRLRLTAQDEFGAVGETLSSVNFNVDNNRPPQALLDEGSFLLGVKDRGNIPLSFTVLDDESDEVQIAIQWKSAGGDFPLVRNGSGQEVELGSLSAGELRDLLENPARRQDRLDAQIAEEAPKIYEGRFGTLASGLAPNQVRLPELASSQAGLLARGIVGRELEVVRPDRLETLEIGLAGACGAYVTEEGRSALVLYDSGGSTWRINEVDLADGTLLSTVGSGAGTPRAMGVDPMGETLFVGTDQNVFRLERFTGVVSAPVAHGMTDGPRALAAMGDDVVLGTGDDELRRLDFGAGATTPNAVLMSGLAQPWGVVRDPLRASGIYLAESTASTGGAAPGRVVSVDLDRLVLEGLAAEVAPEDQGSLGSVPFPNVRALALERSGSRLLAITSQNGRQELRSLALRSPLHLSDPVDGAADPFVREMDLVADVNGAVAAGRFGIRVVAPWTGSSVGVSGGAAQVRSIESYDSTNQVVTLDSALDPALGAGGGVRWRVQTRLELVSSSPTGRSAAFLWHTSRLPDPPAAEVRLLAADADVNASGSSSSKSYRSDWKKVQPTLPVGLEPSSVEAADLDGDGDMDLVSANRDSGDLTLYFQTRPGEFRAEDSITLPVGLLPRSVAAADLDGDADTDLVAANYTDNNLTLYFQTAPGVFPEKESMQLPAGSSPTSVAAADLDSDGDMDLVSAQFSDRNLKLFFQGDPGEFPDEQSITLPLDMSSHAVTAADLDCDGDMDLVAAVGGAFDHLMLYFQTSPGVFPEEEAIRLPSGDLPISVAVADLDNDGDMDLVSANSVDDSLTLYLQTSPGDFPAEDSITLPTGQSPRSIIAEDLDNDGDIDLLSANPVDNDFTLYFQTSSGAFVASGSPPLAANFSIPTAVEAADLDGDGDMDIVSANERDNDLALYIQESPGAFTAGDSKLPVALAPGYLEAGDLDGDGDMDLLSSSTLQSEDELTLYFQTSPGKFARSEVPIAGDPRVVDLDGDGDMDLLVGSELGFQTQPSKLYFQTSPGHFPEEASITLPPLALGSLISVLAADMDADGDMDLVGRIGEDHVILLFQASPGHFPEEESITLATGGAVDFLAVGDVDGDGYIDLVSLERFSGNLQLYFQTNSGEFPVEDAISLKVGFLPRFLELEDLDDDGDLDLVSSDDHDLKLYFQTGHRGFSEEDSLNLPVGGVPESIAVGDLDGDGDMDLVSPNLSDGYLKLYFQTSPGAFVAGDFTLPAGDRPQSIVVEDLDGDGDLDLATVSYGDSDLTLYFNGK